MLKSNFELVYVMSSTNEWEWIEVMIDESNASRRNLSWVRNRMHSEARFLKSSSTGAISAPNNFASTPPSLFFNGQRYVSSSNSSVWLEQRKRATYITVRSTMRRARRHHHHHRRQNKTCRRRAAGAASSWRRPAKFSCPFFASSLVRITTARAPVGRMLLARSFHSICVAFLSAGTGEKCAIVFFGRLTERKSALLALFWMSI